jgi:hypothetical protein
MKSPCLNCQYKDRDKNICLEFGCKKPMQFALQDHLSAYTQCDVQEFKVSEQQARHPE